MSERKYRPISTHRANDVKGTIKKTLRYVAKGNTGKIVLMLICLVIASLTGVISIILSSISVAI